MEDRRVNSEINRAEKQGPFNILFLKLLLIFSHMYALFLLFSTCLCRLFISVELHICLIL